MENTVKTLFDLATFGVTICAFAILDWGIVKTKAKGQNFFTWLLWSIFDLILYIKIKEENGLSTILVFTFVIGSLSTSLLLFRYKKKWLKSDNKTLYLVAILFFLLFVPNSERTIIIIAIISEVIAGWPLLKETWKNPDESGYTLASYMFFLLGYILTIIENFVIYPIDEIFGIIFIENMMFPLVFIIYSFFDTFPLIKIWWASKKSK